MGLRLVITVCRVITDSQRLYRSTSMLISIIEDIFEVYGYNATEALDVLDTMDPSSEL